MSRAGGGLGGVKRTEENASPRCPFAPRPLSPPMQMALAPQEKAKEKEEVVMAKSGEAGAEPIGPEREGAKLKKPPRLQLLKPWYPFPP